MASSRYVALLRGINVGGNSRVPMADLRASVEAAGFAGVRTYINSGNVVFQADPTAGSRPAELAERITQRLAADFGLPIPTLVVPAARLLAIAGELPEHWVNDTTMKSDVVFLFPQVDDPGVLERLTIRAGVDEVRYTPGAVMWRIDRADQPSSGQRLLLGSALYPLITVRNVNTVRKLAGMVDR